ncbi:MAG TPA: SDR family oxidoreductase [Syntrophomonas sp.]|jgi:NAD(P)-dependent dehydrogenase (short-subunit alcohol dehydrogenase family)|nr:SDR family oxidoreductase [Syntrophomonas sp.]
MTDISYRGLFDLKDKVAIVTGATGILGSRYCAGLAESGAHVVVVDLDQEACNQLAEELHSLYSVKALGIRCDVSSPNDVKKMVEQTIKELGQVNILVNNAASKSADLKEFFAPFEDYSLDEWRRIMSVNIDGMFLVAQAVGRQMVAQNQGGAIVQISSIYGIMGPDQRIYEGSFYLGGSINTPAVYSASKAAVVGLTRYLATYWADKSIRVNTLTPGGVESGQNDEFLRRYSNRIPLGRMARQYEMVGALLYLVSDAASYVTGQNLIVDGGLDAW